ncbi:MAG: fumarylacetoacetate hydrolase family protein [Candidatus Azobacteroides sp.]|nr:fumarylacetoacetate hydrolase family protein [Candidatus Azobacteroides sp.]
MKIFAIGWNYHEHNKEMNYPFPNREPIVFMKPDSALLKDGKPFFIPDFSQDVQYEAEIVVKINRLGKNIAEKFAHRYYNEITLGVDFTARDLQKELKEKGHPWEISKAFDHSAVIGSFLSSEEIQKVQEIDFTLMKNAEIVQKDNTKNMIFSVDKIISYISRFFTLKIGDLIFTGTCAGVGKVNINDHIEGYIQEKKVLDFYVK